MKAYQVCSNWSEGSIVVFAETAGKAKSLALCTDELSEETYKDLQATRLPKIDHLYNGRSIADWSDVE